MEASTSRTPDETTFEVEAEQERDFHFVVDFGLEGVDHLRTDEPPPLGDGDGPNPVRLLAAAVGNCLAASLVFCLRKAKTEPSGVKASATGTLVRTARGRLRVGQLDVVLTVDMKPGDEEKMERCLAQFEDFCIVTESVREGIDVMVEVRLRNPDDATTKRQDPVPAPLPPSAGALPAGELR